MNISVLIEEERLLAELLELPEVSGIYLSADRTEPERLKNLTERIHRVGKKCYYAFPFVFRGESLAYFEPRVSLPGGIRMRRMADPQSGRGRIRAGASFAGRADL